MSGPQGGGDPFGDVVHRYSRREALVDGVLVDVTREASRVEMSGGFSVPVAITAAVHEAVEAIPDRLAGIADVRGRLHDVLWMAACAARRAGTSCRFRVHMPVAGSARQVQDLVVHLGPGDAGEPVVTIGFPEDM